MFEKNTIFTSPLSSDLTKLFDKQPPERTGMTYGFGENTFAGILGEAFENAASSDLKDKMSAVDLVAGTTDDMSGLLIDAQKAKIALSLALQLRSKVVTAYNEIMRMQV